MKVSIAADCHLEFGELKMHNKDQSDILILAGDIFVAADFRLRDRTYVSQTDLWRTDKVIDFFEQINQEWDNILIVYGNHEYYGEDIDLNAPTAMLQKYCDLRNVTILNPGIFDFMGVRFIGTTFWTDFLKENPMAMWDANKMMNDFRVIQKGNFAFRATDALDLHRVHQAYVQHQVEMAPSDVVVITHHAPSLLSIQDEYKSDTLSGAYYSSQEDFIMNHPQIKLWVHGHTHFNVDYKVGDTRVVSNQRGYYGHQKMADTFELKTVEV